VVSKKCACGKRPSFGPPGGKTVHCAGCRVEGDVNLTSKMCSTWVKNIPPLPPRVPSAHSGAAGAAWRGMWML
jgi:hypothetical protein